MKKKLASCIILIVCFILFTSKVHAELVNFGASGEYFYDTDSGIYWWDPSTFTRANGWDSRDEIDSFVTNNPRWKWASSEEINGLVGKSSQGGVPLTEVMGPHQFQTAVLDNTTWYYGSRWIGYYDNPANEPNGWTVQTRLDPPVIDDATIASSGYQGGVENWAPGAWINSQASPAISLTSPYITSPPDINGRLGFGEWESGTGNQLDLDNGFIRVVNDKTRLYVLIDMLDDTGNDTELTGYPRDYFYLTFDVNRDGLITADVDLNYTLYPERENIRYQYYKGPNVWTGLQPETFSSMARGFGCYFSDWTRTLGIIQTGDEGIGKLPIAKCKNHRVWEIAIDLKEIGVTKYESVKMGVRVSSPTPVITENIPPDFTGDFSNLMEIDLTPPPLVFYLAGGELDLEDQPLEVTQAIQTRENEMPLVQDKDTVARVYVDVDGSGMIYPKPAIVSLFAKKGGFDLPGSPLTLDHVAPITIDRENLNHTANFRIPPHWGEGTVEFKAVMRKPGVSTLREDQNPASTLTFTQKETPTFWIVPINSGTNAAPVLPTNAEITPQESYAKVVLPVPDIDFVRRPWQDIGPTTVGNTVNDLNDYYGEVALAWLFGFIFTGESPFDLPDQIYGFNASGGGLSTPLWGGGMGVVARGYIGSSSEGTMVHEMTHNLGTGDCADRDSDGMWGRHVSDEGRLSAANDPTGQCIGGDAGQVYGCNAAGPDPDWQTLFNDDAIGEVGFDTREPWSVSGSQLTVVPADYPDYMSYCQSDNDADFDSNQLPTKWISPYRWERLFDRFATLGATARMTAKALSLAQEITDVLWVNGAIIQTAGGMLKPVKIAPGMVDPIQDIKGIYAIELYDAGGSRIYSYPFNVSFFEQEGGKEYSVPFQFQLPYLETTASVGLLRDGKLLDRILVSKNTPELVVLSPDGGEIWERKMEKIIWTAKDADQDDALTFSIFYSNNRGKTWLPIARNLGDETMIRSGEYVYEVNKSTLPGSDEGSLVRIIATDGYNTDQDESDNFFTVTTNPPDVAIITPEEGAWYRPGEKIQFKGLATDTEDGVIQGEAFFWSYEDTPFATGPGAEAVLPPGHHLVNLFVYDTDGNEGYAAVEILIAEICHGDFDTDGDVDGEDLAIMSGQMGCKGECPADFTGNGGVDAADLGLFADDYGRTDCPILQQPE